MDCVCASSLSIHKSAWKKRKREKKKIVKKILGTINGAKPITHSIFLFLNKSVRRLEIISGDDILVQIVALVWIYVGKSFFEILQLYAYGVVVAELLYDRHSVSPGPGAK